MQITKIRINILFISTILFFTIIGILIFLYNNSVNESINNILYAILGSCVTGLVGLGTTMLNEDKDVN